MAQANEGSRAGAGWRDLRIPGYEAYSVIGRGGHAVVVKARQLSCNRTVAIKLLVKAGGDDRARRRFDHERAAMGRLDDHPNIVLVVDSGFRDDGIPYIVMEHLPGGSLAALVERDGRLGWQRTVAVGIKLAGALQTANGRRVLHRDVKPENMLFSAAFEPKLGDFGIARAVGGIEGAGMAGLSVSQAAPETFDARYSPRSDVYSLASSMMTAMLGHPPFVNGDEEVVPLARICNEPPPNLRRLGVPRVVCETLERAMAKDPADRQPSAAAFGEELRRAQAAVGLDPTPMVILPPLDPPPGANGDPPTVVPLAGPPPPRRHPTLTAPVPAASPPPPPPRFGPEDWSVVPTSDAASAPPWPAVQPAPAPAAPPAYPTPAPAPPPPAGVSSDGVVVPPGSVVIYRPSRRPPARRSSGGGGGLRAFVVLLICVALVATATVAAAAYAGKGYFVGLDGQDVAIFKGRPGGFLFFNPRTEEGTTVTVGDLEADQATALSAGVRQSSLANARAYVGSLRTTTTTSSTTTTSVPRPGGATTTSGSGTSATPYVISEVDRVPAGPAVVPAFAPTLHFTVGTGWRLVEKPTADHLELAAESDTWHLSFVTVSQVYDPAKQPLVRADALDAVQNAPRDVTDWLMRHPQLRVTNPVTGATPEGATGLRQLDVTVVGGYAYENCTEKCLLLFKLAPDRPAVKLVSERSRFYVITTRSQTIVVSASTKQNNLDALAEQVTPIIRSLVIG